MEEKKVGDVIKFFGKIGVAAIRLAEGGLKVGDQIHIVGHTTDLMGVPHGRRGSDLLICLSQFPRVHPVGAGRSDAPSRR